MISFARGLVLRRGERSFEFERDLGDGRVQFKYLDNFEVNTFKLGKLYREILSGDVRVVYLTPQFSRGPVEPDWDSPPVLPTFINAAQEALIGFRMHYVKAALRLQVMAGSARQCEKLIANTARPQGVNTAEDEAMQGFKTPSPATLMRWLKVYRNSGGSAYALLDRRPLAPRPKRIPIQVEEIVDQMIAKHYLQLRGKSVKETAKQLVLAVAAENRRNGSVLVAPSERTLNRRILEISPYIRDVKRVGVEYARNKWRYSLKGDQSTRPLERAEIDHTLLDIWVLDPRSGVPLGRPWITVIIDRMSGYLLGVYISFYGPSSATVASALRMSILPKDEIVAAIPDIKVPWTAMGVAETYVVDNGLEFHAQAFRRMAWELSADLIYNPVRQPWLKSSIERSMMEFNRVLPGRGKVFAPMKNVQPLDPQKSAAILFDDLCSCLIQWAAEVFPYRIHPKTLVRPIDLWEEGRIASPPPALPTSLKQLELCTGISTERTIGGDGVFFQYMRYNSVELQDYCRMYEKSFRTEVRFNPDDLGRMHVHLPKAKEWLPVDLQRPSQQYGNGLSLLQHQMNREEAGKKLTRANAEEELLRADLRNKDRWNAAIQRGVQIRKDADLIRMQGYTSALVTGDKALKRLASNVVPEPSPITLELLPELMPFKTFSLSEEF